MGRLWTALLLAVAACLSFNAGAGASPQGYEEDFERRKSTLNDNSCFDIFNSYVLKGERLEAMKFLYAYLPLPDISSYSPEFFLANVDASLKAREEMPWGKDIPEREFRHFVLPLRVNNEKLDSSRLVFYEQLRERVRDLTLEEAILEVNHWCHERVTYRPSDGRTSNPLSTVSQAIGRCGEESTFTVAALRAVGIPARQVYTPRWAHTDDNHAWVEAWANGKWHFLGACEPEPVLDLAWFNIPASRGMIMNTTVFGKYDGPEEKFNETDLTTVINVTENYAPVDILKVRVEDADRKPVENAKVNFCIYNYTEFYPVTSRLSDASGEAQIICGLGDMVVWASDGERFGFIKASPGNDNVWTLVLDRDASTTADFELDIVPPRISKSLPEVDPAAVEMNARRLAEEDGLRNRYVATFIDGPRARDLAARNGWDEALAENILVKSRGNHPVIVGFLESLDRERLSDGWALLGAVSEKDLRDISREVLDDNLSGGTALEEGRSELYVDYVLNPRVENEPLVPYKGFFRRVIDPRLAADARRNPLVWIDWVRENIAVDTVWNPQNIHTNPMAVWAQRAADKRSRNIFFVATMRSMGVPARIDQVTGKTQYHDGQNWIDVLFDGDASASMAPQGTFLLSYGEENSINNPVYYSHFSIHKIENGIPRQLEFDEGAGFEEIAGDLTLDEGQYMMISGQRMSDGSVLVRGNIFPVVSGATTEGCLVFRKDDSRVSVIGSLDAEHLYHDVSSDTNKSILSTTGRGYYVLGIVKSNNEPSAHALNDISLCRDDFENLPERIMILFNDEDDLSRFDFTAFPNLPANVVFGVDSSGAILGQIAESVGVEKGNLPVFVIADSFNRVMFVSQGYTIGLGHQILDTLSKMRD